jgi:starch synthase
MKITYTAPNRAHHYPYALGLEKQDSLHAFVSGFSRLSPRSKFPEIGDKLVRRDLLQTLYLISLRLKAPEDWSDSLNRASNWYLDRGSYSYAAESDVFIYYRTTGVRTARRLKSEGKKVMCVMEEVNSHVLECDEIMKTEYYSLGLDRPNREFIDVEERLAGYDEADYILCSSSWVKRSFIKRGVDESKLLPNPYGFSKIGKNQTGSSEVRPTGKFRILYVGQLHYRKGLKYLVDAFSRFKHPNKELVIVGPKTAVTGLEKSRIPENVIFTGELKGEELSHEYETATIFCLPSLEEGLALVLGEALSYGLPIVTTDQTGADDLIVDGEQGWIGPAASSDFLLECFQKLADQPDLLNQMKVSAKLHSTTLGGWEKSTERLFETLRTTYENWI